MYGLLLSIAMSAGPKSGTQAQKDLTSYTQTIYKEMKAKSANVDMNDLDAKVKAKAQGLISGLDPKTMDLDGAVDWANVFEEAGSLKGGITILTRYVGSTPAPADIADAKIELANLYVEDKNIDPAVKIALSKDPGLASKTFELAYLDQAIAQAYSDMGHSDSALSFLDKASAAIPATDKSSHSMLDAAKTQIGLIGKPAPELTLLAPHYGDFTNLAALKGKPVILDFFAHWCGPCKASMPEMHKITDEFGPKGLQVIGVTAFYGNFNGKKVSQDVEYQDMAGFMKQYQIDHPVAYVMNSEMSKYGVTGIPEFVLIGKDGLVKKLQIGYGPGALDGIKAELAAELKD